jgi:uracil-DNA glycosylase
MEVKEMLALLDEKVCECTKCDLAKTRTNTVFGEGNPKASVMFVGEGPGKNEDEQGRPFVGKAGELLDNIISSCGWNREDVYIANIVKCRPPQNRVPTDEEVMSCRPYLDLQIRAITPKYIVCLGATATTRLLKKSGPMAAFRGEWHQYKNENVNAKVLCTFHPAYLLRNPKAKKDCWNDMQMLLKEMKT